MTIIDQILSSPPAIAAVVAAILALISGVLGPLVQLAIGKSQTRAAQTREIARMRLAWMEKVRDTVSEFHSILMSVKDSDKEAQELSRLGTEIDLLLNRDDKAQNALWEITDKIYNCADWKKRQTMDEALIKAGRNVLKSEWEKIKAEMRGEDFQTGE